jgi:hypothetical protein
MKKFFLILLFLSVSFNIYSYSKKSAVKIVKKYQKIAKSALDELDTDKAKKNLLKAISLIESYKLTDKKFADIYISAGVLNLMIEDGGEAVSFFKKALELNPEITIPENFSSDDVNAAFKKAKESSEKTDESFTFDTVTYKIVYSPPKTYPRNKPLNVKVKVNPLPPSGYDIQVMFIGKGNTDFESLNLTRSQNNEYIGVIPGLSIPTKELKLYILMIDDDLNPVTMFGSESDPLKIKIIDSNLDTDLDLDLDDESNDSTAKNIKKKQVLKKNLNDDFPILGFKLEFGTGIGIAHGKPKYTSLDIDPGLAWSPAWVTPDLSFYITPRVMIGITGRIQFVEKAWNIALKGQTLIYNTSGYKLFTDFGIGYGTVRYRVDVSNAYPEQGNDIVVHGDVFLFSGVTFIFMFNDYFGFSSSAKINLIVPDISILMDLGAGLYMEF